MMDDVVRAALLERHVEGVEHERRLEGVGHRPADDPAAVDTHDHGQERKADQGREVGDVRHPELVGR